MRQELPTPVVVGVILLVLLIVGVVMARGLFGRTQIVAGDKESMPPAMQRMFTNPAGQPAH